MILCMKVMFSKKNYIFFERIIINLCFSIYRSCQTNLKRIEAHINQNVRHGNDLLFLQITAASLSTVPEPQPSATEPFCAVSSSGQSKKLTLPVCLLLQPPTASFGGQLGVACEINCHPCMTLCIYCWEWLHVIKFTSC